MKNTLVFLAFFSIETEMFSNSMLATLNAREDLRTSASDQITIALSTTVNNTTSLPVFSDPNATQVERHQ
ncbi:hypothetical protein R3P38DRAFT_1926624 [Favolaschia claudopus]|uniref:Uncharacterized protein n=1 Tax=Favolaschia claudopus TaxID=2862362 RepID=A0AAW0A1L7_9AGAR